MKVTTRYRRKSMSRRYNAWYPKSNGAARLRVNVYAVPAQPVIALSESLHRHFTRAIHSKATHPLIFNSRDTLSAV